VDTPLLDIESPLGFALRGARLVKQRTIPQVALATNIPQWRIDGIEQGDRPTPSEFRLLWQCLTTEGAPQ
jgi:hypothetical protein